MKKILITIAAVVAAVNGEFNVFEVAGKSSSSPTKSTKDKWEYLDNGLIRIGVNKSRGSCIGFFGNSKSKRNVLNHYDHGRFIQQSYYGDLDGSNWNGKEWRYNPIQGGSWQGKDARVLELRINKNNDSL